MKTFLKIAVLLTLLIGGAMSTQAQDDAVPPPAPAYQPLSDPQLDQLLGPIALYPDPLLAEILPAATFPAQIVMADRYIAGGGDPSLISQQLWDPSVQAIAHYPDVLKWMDDNLNGTTQLGEAFLNQQQAVTASIQRLRGVAFNRGNLLSTPQQQVTNDDGDITIDPTDDQDMYVPVYQPDQVYDQDPDGSPYITFGDGYPLGDWLDDDFDWGNGQIYFWNPGYPRPHDWRHGHHGRDPGATTVWHPRHNSQGSLVNSIDRGWATAPSPEIARQEVARQVPQQEGRIYNAPRIEQQAPVEYNNQVYRRPEAEGALIGVQSSRDTRSYSDRGQQSMREVSSPVRSAPAPAMSGGHAGGGFGGGGGGGGRR